MKMYGEAVVLWTQHFDRRCVCNPAVLNSWITNNAENSVCRIAWLTTNCCFISVMGQI